MKLIAFCLILSLCLVPYALSAPPPIEWERTYGGDIVDWGRCIQQTPDGGFIMSGARDRNVYTPWMGKVYQLKIDAEGTEEWSETHGIENYENVGQFIQQTTDGGYIITGFTGYTYHIDAYVVRTDSQGRPAWTCVLGEFDYYDNSLCVRQTTDGGFVITGWTGSYGAAGTDLWLIKLDERGNTEWKRTYGGAELDGGDCISLTSDGGFILTGVTCSYGSGGNGDLWLVKTDSLGTEEWTATFGGPYHDAGKSVLQTADGGYIITGSTSSLGAGNADVWLIKTDSQGNEEWSQTFGGSAYDEGRSVVQTADGGYFITGDYTDPEHEDIELYMIKTDAAGVEEWSYIIDHGNLTDSGSYGIQTTDGGYIVTGETGEYNLAAVDALIIKLEGSNSPPYLPNHPEPEDGAEEVDVHATLSWTGGDPDGDAVTYDVYFGTSPEPPLVQEDLPDSLYTPGMLDPHTQFFWKIVAADIYEAKTEGPVWTFTTGGSASMPEPGHLAGTGIRWHRSHPNPFGADTQIAFALSEPLPTTVHICDITGQRIRTLLAGRVCPAGTQQLAWDGRDDGGHAVGSGVYFYEVNAGAHAAGAKIMLLR